MTKLPEPNFIERDADTITNEWIALYEEKTGKTLQPAQIERILIDVGVYRENLLRIKIQEVAKSNLLSYAPLEVLEHLGELVGVKKLAGKPALTNFKFVINEVQEQNIIIPKNTEIETEDGEYIFVTDKDCVISPGERFVEVSGTCLSTGNNTNGYETGTINNLLTAIDFIESVYNTKVSYGGSDEEDIESLRERIRLAPESFSNAGSEGAYRFHTLSAHQDITDVAVLSDEAGIVDIYPLTKNGNPTQEIIDIVTEYLSDEKVRPLTDKVIVHEPERIDFTINANLILYLDSDIDSVQKLVNEKLSNYKTEISSKLGKDIVPSQIIEILSSVYGVYKVDLVSPAYQQLNKNQWANLTSFNIQLGGYADE